MEKENCRNVLMCTCDKCYKEVRDLKIGKEINQKKILLKSYGSDTNDLVVKLRKEGYNVRRSIQIEYWRDE